MARRKKKTVIPEIRLEKYAAEGKSIGHLEDGKVVFIKGGIPGDTAEVLVLKNKTAYAEGQVLKIITPSQDRVQPFCRHFGICGGCVWQMLSYKKQLEYKQQQVADQLSRIGNITLPPISPILGCERDRLYRNKVEYTFSALRYLTSEEMADHPEWADQPAVGFHAKGRFDKVVPIEICCLQEEPTNKIKNTLRDWALAKGLPFYNARTKEGWLRNLVIRISKAGEVLVNLIVYDERPELKEALDLLLEKCPEITSLHYTVNDKMNDTIYDLPVVTYAGKGYIEEFLGDFKYKISPKSFFQTNSYQAEKLYEVVRNIAGLTGKETVYDMYCGTGSIGIFLSKGAAKIVGIDSVEDAIADAKLNADWNGLQNCTFYAGDVAKLVNPHFFEENGKPDVVITDPPRPGMSEVFIKQLLTIKAKNIVYVSCNPATQARDLALLDEQYEIVQLQPVDMFPQTHHIENVALLKLRS